MIAEILSQVVRGERLTERSALALFECAPDELSLLGGAACAVCHRLHPEPYRTFNVDRNINYTNICISGCRFCAFSVPVADPRGWVIDLPTICTKIEETLSLGGDQILLQGGLHPTLPLEWYESLLREIHTRYPQINIHGFGPPEIVHFASLSGETVENVLRRLRRAGLGSLPGGGAEILSDRVRHLSSPRKASADEWISVCRTWHQLGGRGSATMMFGHQETFAERVEHLSRIRSLQDETGGFTAFIPWVFQPAHTPLARASDSAQDTSWYRHGTWDYLRTLAISRLFLDNIANIQVSWVTQGLDIGELALYYGANDFGSLMIEENVVAAAGTHFTTTRAEMERRIRRAGYIPRQRNVYYELKAEEGPGAYVGERTIATE